jgi:hypothetical protein
MVVIWVQSAALLIALSFVLIQKILLFIFAVRGHVLALVF